MHGCDGWARRALMTAFCTALIALGLCGTAWAHTKYLYEWQGSFNGAGSTYLGFNSTMQEYHFGSIPRLAVHQSDGRISVFDESSVRTGIPNEFVQGIFSQFTAAGEPAPFSAGSGENAIIDFPGYEPGIAVDNSSTGSDGNSYFLTWANKIFGYDSTGTSLGGNFPISFSDAIRGIAVDPSGNIWIGDTTTNKVVELNSSGTPTGVEFSPGFPPCSLAIDSPGNFYVARCGGGVTKFNSAGDPQYVLSTLETSAIGVDPVSGDVYLARGQIYAYTSSGELIGSFGEPEESRHFGGLSGDPGGIAVNGSTHNIYVSDGGPSGAHVDVFHPFGLVHLPDVTTGSASFTPTTAILNGSVNPDGVDTTSCRFEWGVNTNYEGGSVPCSQGDVLTGSSTIGVSAELTELVPGTSYHYRLVAENEYGVPIAGEDETVKPQGPPVLSAVFASHVHADGASLYATVDPEGAETAYRFEVGETNSYGTTLPIAGGQLDSPTKTQAVSVTPTGLIPEKTYHYRIVGENVNGAVAGEDHTFTTFPSPSGGSDNCPNALVRKQTLASGLLDCRAYELASAGFTGGYDVESDLIPGETPLPTPPAAEGRLLYALHAGSIPGIGGDPTNFSLDPYVATRGPEGWSTEYVGISSKNPFAAGPFGSGLLGRDDSLDTFAFGGDICSPCFEDGSTGIPVRTPSGALVQGMAGSEPVADPTPSGIVRKPLSANGAHLIFGSTQKFEPDGNDGTITIYDRNLATGVTHVVSKEPDGSGTMTEPGIGELGVSADGSRILLGRLISTDAAGNDYWHLYMNVEDSSQTIDLTPNTTSGVLYDGMTADGSKVFFSTVDSLVPGDTDSSGDLYEATVGRSTSSLSVITHSNSDSCNPVPGAGPHWNSVSGTATCDAVGLAGGSGVAQGDGTVYFLSPETLEGSGTQNAPNLFVARPGVPPEFVATLSPTSTLVKDSVSNNGVRSYADFQVTPNGDDAVFSSTLPLTGFPSLGKSEIFRYDAPTESLDCVSCPPTNATPSTNTTLSSFGLNLSDDGRVFFSSAEPLTLRDNNEQGDVYEWENGAIDLISTGTSSTASGLLSVSDNGTDVFFFTRQVLSKQDHNGTAMKIYDAREEGGFFADITPPPCQASDECHGPGTQAAPPPQISTLEGSIGNLPEGGRKSCGKGHIRKQGRCRKVKGGHRHRRKAKHAQHGNGRRHG